EHIANTGHSDAAHLLDNLQSGRSQLKFNAKERGLWSQKPPACECHFTGYENIYAGSGRNPNLIGFFIQRTALLWTHEAS
ncbi:hypothetical protein, partial [Acidithiobacillus thiooxidans]|uniref:hypothetical protein n=1 Tax=Acidithiobacillus thiooxidans TaxID=930 RepID=UPI001A7E0844